MFVNGQQHRGESPVVRAAVLAFVILIGAPAAVLAANLTVTWDPIPSEHVEGYLVYVDMGPGSPTDAVDVGRATSFTYESAVPGVTYFFSVAAYAYGDVGDRSAAVPARLEPPAAPTPLGPTGTITMSTPTFSWMAVAGATGYHVWAGDEVEKGRIQATYSAADAGCSGGTPVCRVVAPVPLATGAGWWAVRASNANGVGPWSAAVDLAVTPPAPVASPATTGPLPVVPRDKVTLHYVDSQETAGEDGWGRNAIDGNAATFWHTQWDAAIAPMPHELQLRLTAPHLVGGVRILPRQDGSRNGRIARYEIYVSNDGGTWGAPVASGSLANVATEQHITFAPVGGQYVRVRVLSEVAGRAFASAAEVTLLGTELVVESTLVPRAGWSLVSVDSEETLAEHGAAVNAFDGNPATHWHTEWHGEGAAMPHDIAISLGGAYPVDGFRYLPRQDGSSNGRIGQFEFYVSLDGVNWGAPVATGRFKDIATEQEVLFAPKIAAYVRLRVLSEAHGAPFTSLAELYVLASKARTATYLVPSTEWALVFVDSQERVAENGAAANAFDGDPATIWHTQWQGPTAAVPHEIQIALGATHAVSGFRYLPRQGSANGRIGRFEFYVSSDGVTWGSPVATGLFTNEEREQEVQFAPTAVTHVRLRALSEVQGNSFTAVAELRVLAER